MKLGGFVIHGNNADTLGRCLDSLLQVCDEVVAVDSMSTDGSAELPAARGIRSVRVPWRGYGAARARAVELLGPCDYVFFLDSDEHLEPEAVTQLHAWKNSSPTGAVYSVRRRNWARIGGRRFVYRTDTRARLVRRDHASWAPEMIVHEAIRSGDKHPTGIHVEHRFADGLERRVEKDERYALLWAIQAHAEGRRPKAVWPQRPAHMIRDLLFGGALFRGGWGAWQLAANVSRYHAKKYVYLEQVQEGRYAEVVAAYRAGRLEDLFSNELVLDRYLPSTANTTQRSVP